MRVESAPRVGRFADRSLFLGLRGAREILATSAAPAEIVRRDVPAAETGIALRSQGPAGVAVHFGMGVF